MKKIINGVTYNTSTSFREAKNIDGKEYDPGTRDIYMTRKCDFFIFEQGFKPCKKKGWEDGWTPCDELSEITPITIEEARELALGPHGEWKESYLFDRDREPNVIIDFFDTDEATLKKPAQLNIRMPVSLRELIKINAKLAGKTANEWVCDLLQEAIKPQPKPRPKPRPKLKPRRKSKS